MDNKELLLNELALARARISELKAIEQKLEKDFLDACAEDIESQLNDNDYNAGTATINAGAYKAKVVISKRIKYSQSGLAKLFQEIANHGDDPLNYMKATYDVSEVAFKNWPDAIQSKFAQYRTVELSKPTIKIEV